VGKSEITVEGLAVGVSVNAGSIIGVGGMDVTITEAVCLI